MAILYDTSCLRILEEGIIEKRKDLKDFTVVEKLFKTKDIFYRVESNNVV